jgi:hypothetical protein
MKDKNKKSTKEKTFVTKDAKGDSIPREYETMSQQQNRHGKGRERNGSEGLTGPARGSNH